MSSQKVNGPISSQVERKNVTMERESHDVKKLFLSLLPVSNRLGAPLSKSSHQEKPSKKQTRQARNKQDQTRPSKTKQDQTRPSKTKQDQARPSNIKQYQAISSKTNPSGDY
ncbi:unnamed protein product [Absidia cylindrospora]